MSHKRTLENADDSVQNQPKQKRRKLDLNKNATENEENDMTFSAKGGDQMGGGGTGGYDGKSLTAIQDDNGLNHNFASKSSTSTGVIKLKTISISDILTDWNALAWDTDFDSNSFNFTELSLRILLDECGLSNIDKNVREFVKQLDMMYDQQSGNEYHNKNHIKDTAGTVLFGFNNWKIPSSIKTDQKNRVILFLSILLHDLGHSGTTNDLNDNLLSRTNSSQYTQSYQEEMHVKLGISLIMKHHLLDEFLVSDMMYILHSIQHIISRTDNRFHHVNESEANQYLNGRKDDIIFMTNLIHLCDISNPIKPWDITQKWSLRFNLEIKNGIYKLINDSKYSKHSVNFGVRQKSKEYLYYPDGKQIVFKSKLDWLDPKSIFVMKKKEIKDVKLSDCVAGQIWFMNFIRGYIQVMDRVLETNDLFEWNWLLNKKKWMNLKTTGEISNGKQKKKKNVVSFTKDAKAEIQEFYDLWKENNGDKKIDFKTMEKSFLNNIGYYLHSIGDQKMSEKIAKLFRKFSKKK